MADLFATCALIQQREDLLVDGVDRSAQGFEFVHLVWLNRFRFV
jgi:hypothetical protein